MHLSVRAFLCVYLYCMCVYACMYAYICISILSMILPKHMCHLCLVTLLIQSLNFIKTSERGLFRRSTYKSFAQILNSANVFFDKIGCMSLVVEGIYDPRNDKFPFSFVGEKKLFA